MPVTRIRFMNLCSEDFEMTDVDGVIKHSDFDLLKSRSSVRHLFLIEPNSGSVIPAAAFCTEQ